MYVEKALNKHLWLVFMFLCVVGESLVKSDECSLGSVPEIMFNARRRAEAVGSSVLALKRVLN